MAVPSPAVDPKEVKDYYVAGEHYDWVVHPKRFEKVFHTLRAKECVRVLCRYAGDVVVADVGCGTGLVTRNITGRKVVGLDINQWNLQQALTHSSAVRVVQADAERLPLRSECFDLLVCTEVLEHLVEPRKALIEMLRALKPGGRLIGSVPSRSWIWGTRRYILSTCPGSEPFHNHFQLNEARELVTLPGCRILEMSRKVLGLNIFFVLQKDSTPPDR